MSQLDIESIAAALADAVYKRVGRNGPGPFKLKRASLYDFSQRTQFREAFIADLTAELRRVHSVHMLVDDEHLYFIHSAHLRSWRTMPRRQLVVPRPE